MAPGRTTEYIYKDSAGVAVGTITRIDNKDGTKTFRASAGFPNPRPLYNLDKLSARPEAPTMIVEGEKAADAAANLREQVQTLARTRAAAATQREALPLVVDVLAELTARLPDDTWLTDLRLSDVHMQLSGYASSAATLVPIIENSPMFEGARLSGPVLPDSSMQRERFSIEADLTPKAGS